MRQRGTSRWVDATWEALQGSGPTVIGGTGGSGTRIFARTARKAGMFIGTNLGLALDARCLKPYLTRWIDAYWPYWNRQLPEDLDEAMAGGLRVAVLAHCMTLRNPDRAWGWKAPRSIYLLPFLQGELPNFRFIHVIRDGRDMAFSAPRAALRTHGPAILTEHERELSEPMRAITLWARVNLVAADYGEQHLGSRYLRIRFEDLCDEPTTVIAQLLDFLGATADAEELSQAVRAPVSLGRWRELDPHVVEGLEDMAGAALARFGYAEAPARNIQRTGH